MNSEGVAFSLPRQCCQRRQRMSEFEGLSRISEDIQVVPPNRFESTLQLQMASNAEEDFISDEAHFRAGE